MEDTFRKEDVLLKTKFTLPLKCNTATGMNDSVDILRFSLWQTGRVLGVSSVHGTRWGAAWWTGRGHCKADVHCHCTRQDKQILHPSSKRDESSTEKEISVTADQSASPQPLKNCGENPPERRIHALKT